MKTKTKLAVAFLTFVSAAGTCFSQADKNSGSDEARYYRLDFVVREVEAGKVINTRSFSMTISTEKNAPPSLTRSNGKVPVPTNPPSTNPPVQTQFTYVDVGVNIDCHAAREISDRLALNVAADINGGGTSDKGLGAPLIRSTRWSSNVIVPLRKPTVIFSSDDAASKIQTQLELTATPIK
jgi:hypothetical protein